MNFELFLRHLGHSLAVNAQGTSGILPSTNTVGVRLDTLVLHCQNCDVDVVSIPHPASQV